LNDQTSTGEDMDVEQYKVKVSFDLYFLKDKRDDVSVCLELNQIFNEMIKVWAKDNQMLATSTHTKLDQV